MTNLFTFISFFLCVYSFGQKNDVDSTEYNDVLLFTNGETVKCIFIGNEGGYVDYYIIWRGMKRKETVLRKRVYSYTQNNITTNISHAKANQTGDRFIMDLNSFSFEFYTGITEYSFNEEYTIPYDTIKYMRRSSYGNMMPLGFTIGFKNYFRGSPEKFISGIKYGITSELASGRKYTHSLGLSIGYTGLLKLSDEIGFEFNFDTGIGIVRWDLSPNYIGYNFSELTKYIQFNPNVLFRYRDVGIGVGYGYYYFNSEINPKKQSLKFYLNYNIN